MDTGTLALLAQGVDGAIAIELGDADIDTETLAGLKIASRRTRQIAGSTVISRAGRDAEMHTEAAQMENRLLQYRASHRPLLAEKIRRAGLESDAVIELPLTVLDEVCDRLKLYRFAPRGDTVHMSATGILSAASDRAQKDAVGEAGEAWWSGFLITVSIVIVSALIAHFTHPLVYTIPVIAGLFGLAASSDAGVPRKKTSAETMYIRSEVVRHEQEGDLVSALWPDMREPQKGMDVRVEFGTPTSETQAMLVALERTRLPIHIAVPADGIRFKESVADALVGIRANVSDVAKSPTGSTCAPIAYVIEGSAVAIIPFGAFPIPSEVIDKIVNTMSLA